ncbi:MAG: phenylalanine--tRNA ligase subunit beta [Actinomycetota bacterium]|jgi:phenylalanyl-tRNA synthetase beta chain|nr:phenylalanine--tRNA ligase subunit beta [Actinomycetota bacterium]
MRVSMKWLKELVDVDLPLGEFKDLLDMTGTAVEAVHTTGEALDGVFVGQIVTREKHPEADKLWVTTVDVGADENLTIVCGAQNFEAGDKVPVATLGSELPNGMKIKKAKLRGVVSMGMNCSAIELGLGTDADGLMILPADAPIGTPFAEYHQMSDTVIELEVTPNRPDCLSMAGVAREVGAITSRKASVPASIPDEVGAPIADSVRVTIADQDLCPRYTARLIRNVKVGPSPEWLAERVTAAGSRSVSNVVDVTNYVMYELGQPLHAFDADTLAVDTDGKAHIHVRRATSGEHLVTLDDQDRALNTEMCMITDPSGPVALGGVMGGLSTEVTDSTVNILLEAASFDGPNVSHTSRSLALISEASTRFERGVDPAGCIAALDRAAALFAEVAGGEVAPGVIDEYPVVSEPRPLTLRVGYANKVLGTDIPSAEMSAILARLGLTVEGEDVLTVQVPTFRPDLEREIDLVEEVVRVWGMERVQSTLPAGRAGGLNSVQRWRERVGHVLRAGSLNETMTYSFIDPEDAERLRIPVPEGHVPVELINPMSGEQAVMRHTLAAGLLRSVSYNLRRGNPDVHLYEIGATYVGTMGKAQARETETLAVALAGSWNRAQWNEPEVELGFFDGKGVVESIMEELGVEGWRTVATGLPFLQPGRSVQIQVRGQMVGWLGEVHPQVLDAYEVDAPVTMFELSLKSLYAAAKEVRPYTEVPRMPAVTMDIALLVDESVAGESLLHAIRKAGGNLLESSRLFDVYRGTGVPEGKKSMAIALTWRAADRTLSDDDVAPAYERMLKKVAGNLGAELRG